MKVGEINLKWINKIMKNLTHYSIILFLVGLLATSCDDIETEAVFSDSFVIFDEASITILENDAAARNIAITMAGPLLSSDLTIDYNVDVVSGSENDFMLSGTGTVTIPAGEVTTSLSLTPVDNLFSDGDKEIVLTITSVSESIPIGLPGPANNNASVAITIGDDDCPVDLASFEGTYSMTVLGAVGAAFEGFDLCAADTRDCSGNVTFSVDDSDPVGVSATLEHASFGSSYGIKFITCSKQVEAITPLTSWFGNDVWNMQQGATLGTYNEDSKAITIIGILGTNGDFEITLTKN